MNFIPSFMKKNFKVNGNGSEDVSSVLSCSLCDAPQFNDLLALERKRAERSRRPFILMLLDLSTLAGETNGNGPAQIIADRLAAATREVDSRGWYEKDEIIGVIFTELGEMDVVEAKDKIRERVSIELRTALYPHQAKHLRISFHVFPEDFDTPETRFSSDLKLYPDLLSEHSSKRISLSLKRLIDHHRQSLRPDPALTAVPHSRGVDQGQLEGSGLFSAATGRSIRQTLYPAQVPLDDYR